MLNLLMHEPTALVVILLAIGWVIYSIKQWFSGREVNKLTKKERELYKSIDSIPSKVDGQTPQQNVEFWNGQEKKDGN